MSDKNHDIEAMLKMVDGKKGDAFHKTSSRVTKPYVSLNERGNSMSNGNENSEKTAIILGYVMAVIIPLIGMILSIYLLVKGRVGHFVGVLALSIFMMFFWIGFWPAFEAGMRGY